MSSLDLHPGTKTAEQSLIQTYCEFYEQYEAGDYQVARTARPKDKLDVISRHLGLVGMDIGQGWWTDNTVDEDLAKIYDSLKESLAGAYDIRHQAPSRLAERLSLIQIVNLLKARGDPSLVTIEQQVTHWNNVQQLEENLAAVEVQSKILSKSMTPAAIELSQRRRGLINEHTAEAILARQFSSTQLSLRALLHHSRNRLGPLSYNNLFVTTTPNSAVQWYRIQVKAGCIGACTEQENPQLLDHHRSQYASDIVLVSGHCDLDVRLDPKIRGSLGSGRHFYPAATLLVEEARGQLSPESLDTLNAYSTSLLQTITTDTSRPGTATYEHAAYAWPVPDFWSSLNRD